MHNWNGGGKTGRTKWEQNGGRQWKRRCRKRDNYTCQLCGTHKDKHSNGLHVHHKVPFADSEELRTVDANGVTLCADCHNYLHSNAGELIRYRWEQEALAELGHLLKAPAA